MKVRNSRWLVVDVVHQCSPILPYNHPFSSITPYHLHLGLFPHLYTFFICSTMSAKIGSPSAPATASNTSDLQRTQPHPAGDDKSQQVEAMSRESSREKREEIEEEIAADADDESDDEEPEVGHDYPTIFVPRAGSMCVAGRMLTRRVFRPHTCSISLSDIDALATCNLIPCIHCLSPARHATFRRDRRSWSINRPAMKSSIWKRSNRSWTWMRKTRWTKIVTKSTHSQRVSCGDTLLKRKRRSRRWKMPCAYF